MAAFLTQIGNVVTSAIGWVGDVVTAMFGESGALKDLLPFLALALGLTILHMGISYIRSFVRN